MADNIENETAGMIEPVDTVGDENGKQEPADEPKPQESPEQPEPPKPPEPTKNVKRPPAPQKKKKKKGRKLKIILIIVIFLLVAGFVFEELYFNYLGTRDIFIDAVVRLDPAFGAREHELDIRETDLDKREADLDARDKAAGFRESQNTRRSLELDEREETTNEREQLSMPLYMRKMSEQELLDMQSLSRAYSLMAPDVAVAILMELERQDDVVAILYNMSERSASAILALMDPEYAAQITVLLLYEKSDIANISSQDNDN